jgi:hypothetical protein
VSPRSAMMQVSAKSLHWSRLQYAELVSSGGQAAISAVMAGPSSARGSLKLKGSSSFSR